MPLSDLFVLGLVILFFGSIAAAAVYQRISACSGPGNQSAPSAAGASSKVAPA